jgi:two-component system chemotaxis response regulator CheY
MSSNVLIADDSWIMRQMIKRAILMAGLAVEEVYEASNGIEALAQLARHDVAVVVLDINMPVMNGVQFLTRMRDDPRLRAVPVVVASTEGSEGRIEQLMTAGAQDYLRKPFHPEQLRDTLLPILGMRADGAALIEGDGDSSF